MRLAVAGQRVAEEGLAARVHRPVPDGLAPPHAAAVALADAMMTRPDTLRAEVVAALHRHFTRVQMVELTIDVMKWNAQKVAVALGLDDEVRPGELTDLVFDEAGNWVRP